MAQEEHEKKTIPFWKKLSWIATVLAFVFSAITYFDTKSSVENKIVETLSERYGIADEEMFYEQALEAVDKEIVKLQNTRKVKKYIFQYQGKSMFGLGANNTQ